MLRIGGFNLYRMFQFADSSFGTLWADETMNFCLKGDNR